MNEDEAENGLDKMGVKKGELTAKEWYYANESLKQKGLEAGVLGYAKDSRLVEVTIQIPSDLLLQVRKADRDEEEYTEEEHIEEIKDDVLRSLKSMLDSNQYRPLYRALAKRLSYEDQRTLDEGMRPYQPEEHEPL